LYRRAAVSGTVDAPVQYGLFLFPRATSQVAMLAWIFGDCREGQIPRCLPGDLIAAGTLMPAAFLGRKNKPGFIASGLKTASGMSSEWHPA